MSRPIVVHFGRGDEQRLTPEEGARLCGVTVAEFEQAHQGLVADGWLVELPDGSFQAAIPGAAS